MDSACPAVIRLHASIASGSISTVYALPERELLAALAGTMLALIARELSVRKGTELREGTTLALLARELSPAAMGTGRLALSGMFPFA